MVSNLALSLDGVVHLATATSMPLTICGEEVADRPQVAYGPHCERCWSTEQVLLLPDACVVCGHQGVVFLRQEDGTLVCVDCIAKETGDADH